MAERILWIDAAAREDSRTRRLAEALIASLGGEPVRRVLRDAEIPALEGERLAWRTDCCARQDFSDPYFDAAKEFAAADTVVIAAPFWDNSFPAVLKKYIESICVTGLTFFYTESGIPQGLCRAKTLYYVTTAGGPIYNDVFGYGYIEAMAKTMFGIPDVRCLKAENLDIVGNDPETILREAAQRYGLALR